MADQTPSEEALLLVRVFQRWMCTVGNFLSLERAPSLDDYLQGYVGREDGEYLSWLLKVPAPIQLFKI